MEAPSETKNPNPSTVTTERNSKTKGKNNDYEFCKVCKLNHNQGRRHNYFPNHVKSLSAFLSRFQSKISDVRFFLKNPSLLRPELASHNRFWCVFCDCDVTEHGSSFACEKGISHLASADHLKNLKSFMWKHGGGMDRVDRFRISDVDFAKYEKKCLSMKNEDASEQSRSRGPLIGPSNDIHNELKFDYVDNFDKSRNLSFPNGVLPLQNHTNENCQVSNSDMSAVAAISTYSYDNKSLLVGSDAKHSNSLKGKSSLTEGYHNNGQGKKYQVYTDKMEANGEDNSPGLQKLTQITSTFHKSDSGLGNVHSGAPPPWFNSTNGIEPVTKKTVIKSKLNPKRVGAAWAEKRKMEIEMEKKGKFPNNNKFDANWLPNFGRVWQSGSRKDSRKEFQVEVKNKKPFEEEKIENRDDLPVQLQPYVSKRMRREANE